MDERFGMFLRFVEKLTSEWMNEIIQLVFLHCDIGTFTQLNNVKTF